MFAYIIQFISSTVTKIVFMKNTDSNHRFIHFILQKQLRDAVKLVKHVKGINKKLIRIIMTRYRNTRITQCIRGIQ